MLIDERMIKLLRSWFNLNLYEAKIYIALLSRGISTPGELSELSGVPRSRSYDILESLERKGLAVIQAQEKGKPMSYAAVAPSAVIEKFKENLSAQVERESKRLEKLKEREEFEELERLYQKGIEVLEPSKLAATLRGRDTIYQHINLALKGSKARVSMVMTTQGLISLWKNQLDSIKDAYERGVKIKIAAPVTDETRAAVEELGKYATIRHLPKDIEVLKQSMVADGAPREDIEYLEAIGGRLFIADGEVIIISVTGEDAVHRSQDMCFWTKSKHLAREILEPMFAMFWQHLEPAEKVL